VVAHRAHGLRPRSRCRNTCILRNRASFAWYEFRVGLSDGSVQGYTTAQLREAFRAGYCTVGDMGRREADGYYYLVDRKSNMIISGGENIYPSEVEQALGAHQKIKDVAVIGIPDMKWGEATHAVVILHDGATAGETDILEWCKGRIAGFKRPKSISFIAADEMPRTATGKILHRVLRDRYAERLVADEQGGV